MPKRKGNEFTPQTRHHLARSVNYMCSKCGCQTSGPKAGASASVTIGKAAHISAAARGGPRFDESLSSEQRRHYDNGIWMCSNHASLIDEDWLSYTTDQLREMKRQAESRAAAALNAAPSAPTVSSLADGLRWRPPATGETRAGYAGLYHVAFVLKALAPQRARAVIELAGASGLDTVRAWISNGVVVRHEHRGLRNGEPCLIPIFTRITEVAPEGFWLDRQLDAAAGCPPPPQGTYITDEAFLRGQHRAALAPGRYRVRAKLLLGDSANRQEYCSDWRDLTVLPEDSEDEAESAKPSDRSRDDLIKALRELRREVIHEVLNVPAPSQDERGPLQLEWIPKAQDWDRRVEQTMSEFGCDVTDIEFVRDFPLPPLRTNAFTYPMNSQWSITDVRREKLEAVLDSLLGRAAFRR